MILYSWPARSLGHKYDGASSIPPSPARAPPQAQDVLAPGTVASRIAFLQSLREQYSTTTTTSFPGRHREHSHASFGRRMTRRFGQPAIRSAQPSDELPAVESRHSFLGLRTVRTNHVGEHGFTDSTTRRYTRSLGINGQVDMGAKAMTQVDDASPWGVATRKIMRNTGRHAQDVLKEIDTLGNQQQYTQPSAFQSTRQDNAEMYFSTKKRRLDYIDSEASIATTSTVRRESVRQLFDDYGIQRPAGLLSKDVSREMVDMRPSSPYKYCHVCSYINSGTSVKCWRCGHRFCSQCNNHTPSLPVGGEDEESDYLDHQNDESPKLDPLPKENQMIDEEPLKQALTRPGPGPWQPKLKQVSTRKPSSPPIRFPTFYDILAQAKEVADISKKQSQIVRAPTLVLPERRVTPIVKESPFVIADLRSPRQTLKLFPVDMQGKTQRQSHTGHHVPTHSIRNDSSEAVSCDRPPSRRTHHSHQHGHVSYGGAESTRHTAEHTEHGHIADTVLGPGPIGSTSRCHSRLSTHGSHHAQRAPSPTHHNHCASRRTSYHPRSAKTEHSHNLEVPEYVECYGYPRTGHDRHGSPISSGIVGECQHCLDDCQCAACQDTHHSVRCCTHADHRSMVHRHYTVQKEATPLPEKTGEPESQEKTESPVKAETKTVDPPGPVKGPTPSSSFSSLKSQSTIKKTSLPLSKASTLANKTQRPPTPPLLLQLLNASKPTSVKERRKSLKPEFEAEATKTPIESSPLHHWDASDPAETQEPRQVLTPPKNESVRNEEPRQNQTLPSRKPSVLTQKYKASLSEPLSPRTASPPGSRKISLKLSQLPESHRRSSLKSLNQQLLNHQDALKKSQSQPRGDEPRVGSIRGSVAALAKKIEQQRPIQKTRTPSLQTQYSGAPSSTRKSNLRLRLVAWRPEVKKPGMQHRLSDDEVVGEEEKLKEKYKAPPSVSPISFVEPVISPMSYASSLQSENGSYMKIGERKHKGREGEVVVAGGQGEEEHECVWKRRFLESGKGEEKVELGIKAITVVIEMLRREDLVARVKKWSGGQVKV